MTIIILTLHGLLRHIHGHVPQFSAGKGLRGIRRADRRSGGSGRPGRVRDCFCCIISTNAPRLPLCSSPLVPSGSYRQARPIAARSERAPEVLSVLEGRSPGRFLRPGVRRLQPCTAPSAPLPADACGPDGLRPAASNPSLRDGSPAVPYPRINTRRSYFDSHR